MFITDEVGISSDDSGEENSDEKVQMKTILMRKIQIKKF